MRTPKQLKEKMEPGLDTILNKFVEENYFKLDEGVLFICDCSETSYECKHSLDDVVNILDEA